MKTLLAAAALTLALTTGLQASTITSAGTLVNLTPAGFGSGTDNADLDAQGAGTGGFVLFNSVPEGTNVAGTPWNQSIVSNLPAYVSSFDGSASAGSGGWANYDDVTIGGNLYNTGGLVQSPGNGVEVPLLTFQLSGLVPAGISLGVLVDNSDSPNWDVTNVRIEGPGSITANQDVTRNGGSDLVQFDIAGGLDGEVYTIYGTSPASGALIGGVTFDAAIDITDPTDGDGDLMGDNWERFHFGDLTTSDGTGDSDSDGLTDLEEWQEGTLPLDTDTDNDGLSDSDEVNTHMTDPKNRDSDEDGLNDGAEINDHMTDPNEVDSDMDGHTDSEEINHLPPTDPTDPNSFPVAGGVSLLAYFPFEGNYNDATGNGYDAAPVQNPGEVSIVPGGLRGQGADINDPDMNGGGNTGGTINIPINANPDETPAVTFGGWVNLESNNGFPGFMAIDNGGWDRGMHLNNGQWGIASGENTPNVAPATVGEWQFVVGTFDKPNDEAVLYVGDDDPLTQTTITTTRPDASVNPGELVIEIGRYDNQDLDAVVDDVFVFAGALSAHEVNAIRNLRLSSADLSPADVAEMITLFRAGSGGPAGSLTWSPTSGLDATNPGAVFEGGGGILVVLNDAGDGMKSGAPFRFVVTREPGDMLKLTWESQAGKRYKVRSETDASATLPVNWPIWNGNTEIMATPPENTLLFPVPADPLRLFVIEQFNPPPVTAFSDDFENGQGGWTTGADPDDAGNTLWGLGAPVTAGPLAANSLTNCFGTNIDDNYEIDARIWLRSPPIDLTAATGGTLRFFHFADFEGDPFDWGTVNILDAADDSILAIVQDVVPSQQAPDWEEFRRSLPPEALGKTVKLEFRFHSDEIQNLAGWYIDDVEVTVPAP
ncbi:MAG: hypothetical protein OSB65_08180 [Roseibacillus sp.]|nr:hypothetical protein [Roseibacillus sp.]